MIDKEDLQMSKDIRLRKLINVLEDQDKLLEYIIDKMPRSDEKNDLVEIKRKLLDFLHEVDECYFDE